MEMWTSSASRKTGLPASLATWQHTAVTEERPPLWTGCTVTSSPHSLLPRLTPSWLPSLMRPAPSFLMGQLRGNRPQAEVGLGRAPGLDREVSQFRGFQHPDRTWSLLQTTSSRGVPMGLKPTVDPRDPGREISLWKEPVAFGK